MLSLYCCYTVTILLCDSQPVLLNSYSALVLYLCYSLCHSITESLLCLCSCYRDTRLNYTSLCCTIVRYTMLYTMYHVLLLTFFALCIECNAFCYVPCHLLYILYTAYCTILLQGLLDSTILYTTPQYTTIHYATMHYTDAYRNIPC